MGDRAALLTQPLLHAAFLLSALNEARERPRPKTLIGKGNLLSRLSLAAFCHSVSDEAMAASKRPLRSHRTAILHYFIMLLWPLNAWDDRISRRRRLRRFTAGQKTSLGLQNSGYPYYECWTWGPRIPYSVTTLSISPPPLSVIGVSFSSFSLHLSYAAFAKMPMRRRPGRTPRTESKRPSDPWLPNLSLKLFHLGVQRGK